MQAGGGDANEQAPGVLYEGNALEQSGGRGVLLGRSVGKSVELIGEPLNRLDFPCRVCAHVEIRATSFHGLLGVISLACPDHRMTLAEFGERDRCDRAIQQTWFVDVLP